MYRSLYLTFSLFRRRTLRSTIRGTSVSKQVQKVYSKVVECFKRAALSMSECQARSQNFNAPHHLNVVVDGDGVDRRCYSGAF